MVNATIPFTAQQAYQVYGEGKAAQIEMETDGEYNDEGSTDYSIVGVFAYDDNHQKLDVDTTTPFMKLILAKDDEDEEEENYEDEDYKQAIKDYYFYGKKEDKPNYILWEDLPVDVHNGGSETYDLRTMPLVPTIVIQTTN